MFYFDFVCLFIQYWYGLNVYNGVCTYVRLSDKAIYISLFYITLLYMNLYRCRFVSNRFIEFKQCLVSYIIFISQSLFYYINYEFRHFLCFVSLSPNDTVNNRIERTLWYQNRKCKYSITIDFISCQCGRFMRVNM